MMSERDMLNADAGALPALRQESFHILNPART